MCSQDARRRQAAIASGLSPLVAATWLALTPAAMAQQLDSSCGNPFVNNFGPHDYRVAPAAVRKVVEDYHFAPRVESLLGGMSGSLGSEIDYTLRAFPNHHRALVSMMNLGVRVKSPRPVGAQFTVECYFQRAIAFRADDLVVRMLYAKYLSTQERKPEAMRQLDYAVEKSPENGFTQFNAGLLYMEMGEPERALAQAHRALRLGFEGTALRDKLVAAGKWVEPAPATPASSPPQPGS